MKNNKPANMIIHKSYVNPHDISFGFSTKTEREYELKFMKAELLSALSAIDQGKKNYRLSALKKVSKTK